MKHRRLTQLAAVVVGVSALFASACSKSAPTADAKATTTVTGATAATATQTPKAGDCLEPMTPELASGFQMPAIVACDQPHGGEVISVAKLSDDAKAAYPAMGRSLLGADAEVKKCNGAGGDFDKFAGANVLTIPDSVKSAGVTQAWRVSGIDIGTFVPGTAAWSAGQRWMACAAVLNNTIEVPSKYTGSAKDGRSTAGTLAVDLAWCKKQQSAESDFSAVPCSDPHNYEQLANFVAGSNDATFPGDTSLNQLAKTLCPALDSTATAGKSDKLPTGFGESWLAPTESSWGQGDRIVRCYATTTTGVSTGTVGSGTAKLAS